VVSFRGAGLPRRCSWWDSEMVPVTLPTGPGREARRHRRRGPWAAAGALAVVLVALGVRRHEVVGDSMLPTLEPGDRVLVVRVPRRWPLTPGSLVAVPDPRAGRGRLLVKRATSVAGGSLDVHGDNPSASTDSRQFGSVPRRSVVGVVLYRYAPPGRTGRLHRRS